MLGTCSTWRPTPAAPTRKPRHYDFNDILFDLVIPQIKLDILHDYEQKCACLYIILYVVYFYFYVVIGVDVFDNPRDM